MCSILWQLFGIADYDLQKSAADTRAALGQEGIQAHEIES